MTALRWVGLSALGPLLLRFVGARLEETRHRGENVLGDSIQGSRRAKVMILCIEAWRKDVA